MDARKDPFSREVSPSSNVRDNKCEVSRGVPRHVAVIMDGHRRFGRVKYGDPLKVGLTLTMCLDRIPSKGFNLFGCLCIFSSLLLNGLVEHKIKLQYFSQAAMEPKSLTGMQDFGECKWCPRFGSLRWQATRWTVVQLRSII